jgi:hypothetical protein
MKVIRRSGCTASYSLKLGSTQTGGQLGYFILWERAHSIAWTSPRAGPEASEKKKYPLLLSGNNTNSSLVQPTTQLL